MNTNNRRIKLTEDELKQIISESVEQIVSEGASDFARGIFNKLRGDASSAGRKMTNKLQDVGRSAYNKIHDAGVNAYGKANKYYNDVKKAGELESNKADARRAINVIIGLNRKGILGQNITNMVVGNLKRYGNK